MAIQVGDKIPATTFRYVSPEGPKEISSDELFRGKKVVLFAVPGAFTPACSQRHLPGYVDKAAELKAKGIDTIEGTIRVFLGGPVQPQLGFVIHSADYRRRETLVVGEQLAMTANQEVLRDIAHHQGPAKYLFAVGYAGWGAGQLEAEIARRDWFTAPADPELVFDADRDTVWDKSLALRTREL